MNSNVASSEELSMLAIEEHEGAMDSVSDFCHIFTSKLESKLVSQRLKLSPLSLVAVEQLRGGIPNKLFSFVVNVFEFLGWWLIVVALQSIWCLWDWLSTTTTGDTAGWVFRALSTWKLSVIMLIMVQSVTSKDVQAWALLLMFWNEWLWWVKMFKSDHNPLICCFFDWKKEKGNFFKLAGNFERKINKIFWCYDKFDRKWG